jgi:non-ribosomal peptide synthetase component F/thioesterase domain-containing protein
VAQERFWLLDRLEPGNPSYSVAVRWRLQGPLSSELLERAWRKIIQRHEVLRTVFPEIDGKPVQRVLQRMPFKLTEINISHLPEDTRAQECDRIGLIEARAPFDLASGPLLRVTLVRLSSDDAVLLVTTHQVVSDGWSIGIMAKEMGLIYGALSTGKPAELPELPLQYGDYALWQLNWLQARGMSAETEYWTRQLAGVRPFQVIADHPRSAVPTTNGAIASRVLPRELTNRAQALSGERGATLFAAALGALCATLTRYTGESEIVLGTQVSDRDQVELEPMIGQFVNSLILRIKLEDDPRFADLIEKLRDTVSDALEHRHIPIERLLAMVKAERTGVNSAPISINFIFQKTFIQNAHYGEMKLVDMPSLPAGAIYDLNFFMVERPDGWRFSCQYNTDQFDGSTAERLLLFCQNAMESGVADPGLRVSELRIADPEESTRLLATLRDTRADYPQATVDQLFETLAASQPAAPAVQYGKVRLSRRQLNDAANHLAQALRPHVSAPGTRIALCLERSAEYVTAMLAVLKAGAAFVTIDPRSTPDEIASRLAAARAATVVTDAAHEKLLATAGVAIIRIEPGHASPQAPSQGSPATQRSVDSDACVTFSASRSEAAPVAIGVGHRALVNLLRSLQRQPGIGSDDVLVTATAAEDDCTSLSALAALLAGARLVLATSEQTASGHDLSRLLELSGATLMAAPAAVWSLAVQGSWNTQRPLKLILAGDDLDGELLDRLLARGEVWRAQGWPEAALWSSVAHVKQRGDERLLEPIANTTFRLLDRSLHPPPVGAVGELQVCGDGVVSPQGTHPTGRRARLRSNGRIELIALPERRAKARAEAASAPLGELEERLAAIWSDMLGVPGIDAGANFFELGGHSLLAARMLARVEREFGHRITLATLFHSPTIRGLAQALQTDKRSFDFRQVVKLQANGSSPPLIAINNTGVYYLLAKRLGEDQPVTSLQLFDPSLKDQTVPASVEELAASYVELIRRVQSTGPYQLMGWCAAGPLTFEIARQLAQAGETVSGLYLMDSWIPGYLRRQPLLRRLIGDYSLRWQFFLADWRRFRAGEFSFGEFLAKRGTMQRLPGPLIRRSAAGDETPRSLPEPELYDQWLLRYLQDTTARYEPKPYPGKLVLFRSRQEPTGWLFDPRAGWDAVAVGGVELHMVDGDHFTMFQDPGAGQIAVTMTAARVRAQSNLSPHDAAAPPLEVSRRALSQQRS